MLYRFPVLLNFSRYVLYIRMTIVPRGGEPGALSYVSGNTDIIASWIIYSYSLSMRMVKVGV
jgi:hypothetical protein